MYLLLLYFLHRRYAEALRLIDSCMTDTPLSDEEQQIWDSLEQAAADESPDAHAVRLRARPGPLHGTGRVHACTRSHPSHQPLRSPGAAQDLADGARRAAARGAVEPALLARGVRGAARRRVGGLSALGRGGARAPHVRLHARSPAQGPFDSARRAPPRPPTPPKPRPPASPRNPSARAGAHRSAATPLTRHLPLLACSYALTSCKAQLEAPEALVAYRDALHVGSFSRAALGGGDAHEVLTLPAPRAPPGAPACVLRACSWFDVAVAAPRDAAVRDEGAVVEAAAELKECEDPSAGSNPRPTLAM